MVQKSSSMNPSLGQTLLFKGIFDFPKLYKVVYDWLISRGYEVHESKFKTISKATGRERQMNWAAYKKVNEFVAYWIYIEWMANDAQEIEVVENNEKKKLVKAQLVVRVQHSVELDFSRRFTKTAIHRHLLEFLHNWMFRKKIDTLWEDNLRFKCYDLVNYMKESLNYMTKGNEHYDVW